MADYQPPDNGRLEGVERIGNLHAIVTTKSSLKHSMSEEA